MFEWISFMKSDVNKIMKSDVTSPMQWQFWEFLCSNPWPGLCHPLYTLCTTPKYGIYRSKRWNGRDLCSNAAMFEWISFMKSDVNKIMKSDVTSPMQWQFWEFLCSNPWPGLCHPLYYAQSFMCTIHQVNGHTLYLHVYVSGYTTKISLMCEAIEACNAIQHCAKSIMVGAMQLRGRLSQDGTRC